VFPCGRAQGLPAFRFRCAPTAADETAEDAAHVACTALFGGGVREGFPNLLVESEARPLMPDDDDNVARLRDRLQRNIVVFENLKKGSSTGPSKKRRKE
jgi:hypothetical protein